MHYYFVSGYFLQHLLVNNAQKQHFQVEKAPLCPRLRAPIVGHIQVPQIQREMESTLLILVDNEFTERALLFYITAFKKTYSQHRKFLMLSIVAAKMSSILVPENVAIVTVRETNRKLVDVCGTCTPLAVNYGGIFI